MSAEEAIKFADAEYNANELRGSRQSLSKPNEKASDGAAEKLLSKELEARIVTQDNMADAKYIVGDQRNGDAKIEIDASKRTFTGLTKEELLKYQNDPFWVRMRWAMFVLFWTLWVCMLVGAVAIIVQSPKCSAPETKKWYEQGPLVELGEASSLLEVEDKLPLLQQARVQGVIVPAELAGGIYDAGDDLVGLKGLVEKAKDAGVKIVVDMTANFVNKSHEWFARSERSESNYTDYFVWAPARGLDAGARLPPNNWVSTLNEPAWTWSEARQQFYLHQYSSDTPDLNFTNPRVADEFDAVIRKWAAVGVAGIRLQKAQQLLVDRELTNDNISPIKSDGSFKDYAYYSHRPTSDRPDLLPLLQRWRQLAHSINSEFLLSMAESVPTREPYFTRDSADGNRTLATLELPAAGRVPLAESAQRLATHLSRLLQYWPAVQFESDADTALEAGVLGLLLPATPVLLWEQIFAMDNNTWKVEDAYAHLVELRSEAVLMHGKYNVTTFARGALLACTRWLPGGAGYLAVYNPAESEAAGDAAELPHVPAALAVSLYSPNYNVPNVTRNSNIRSQDLVVSPRSVVVLTFVPVVDE